MSLNKTENWKIRIIGGSNIRQLIPNNLLKYLLAICRIENSVLLKISREFLIQT